MCTVVIRHDPAARWPLLLAANRDEMADRPWSGPGRHWPARPQTLAGLDRLAGGSWMGANDAGVVAAILNRAGSLGPAAGRRSRGELVLAALDHTTAGAAVTSLSAIDPGAYRPFNLVLIDREAAYCLLHRDPSGLTVPVAQRLPVGLTMVTGFDPNDPTDPRIRDYLPRFVAADTPVPETGDWSAWGRLLASRHHAPGTAANAAMCFRLPSAFGTVCSCLLALPAAPGNRPDSAGAYPDRPSWLFAAGPPDVTPWQAIPFASE